MFFATKEDLSSILIELEESVGIIYAEMGLLDSNKIQKYFSYSTIPNFGHTQYGSWISLDHRYMIMLENSSINIRSIPQLKGGIKYAFDQMLNPDSIEFSIGGIYLKKEKVLVAGRIGTVSDSSFSKEIYTIFQKKIKRDFKRIENFYVGKTAEEKLLSGWRLVTNEKLSKDFDLTPLVNGLT